MSEHQATRTLVKSPPELWEVCSDAALLGRHLEPFGEIRITRLEPETTVAWEGERASGTVTIEPSGWGTRVTLTASSADPEPVSEPAPVPEPAPVSAPEHAGVEPSPPPAAPSRSVADPAPPPPSSPEPVSEPRRRRWWHRFARVVFDTAVAPVPVPEEGLVPRAEAQQVEPPPAPAPAPAPARARARARARAMVPASTSTEPGSDVLDALHALEAALDSLGQAHHRPFSRG